MTTLRQLYTQFGHDPKWTRFATASTQPMVNVYLRKLGDRDVSSLSDFDLALQLDMSEQPHERKVKAEACMRHMLRWAEEHGHTDIPTLTTEHTGTVPAVSSEAKPERITEGLSSACSSLPKERKTKRAKSGKKKHKVIITLQPKPERKHKQADELDREKWLEDTRPRRGAIYHDTASKGDIRAGSRRMKDCYRAEITIQGIRFRHRAETRQECAEWLKAVTSKKILPTDNKADWWRMEQRKDEVVRIDEIIVNQAEESVMLYDYHQTHDLSPISQYVVQRLLPHMVYYCCHTLSLSQHRTQTASKQAIALLLTRIIAGRPVANFTNSCKRMLRTYRDRGDFFYYETKAPREVKLMVNRIDMSALAELYKVTKDRRI